MEKVATDIYTFAELRQSGFTYVDKTEQLWEMASGEKGKQFFIARPRRFGKSLAVSTLKSLFEGRRELFAGLAIEPKWDWSKQWPVLHLDMGSVQYDTVEELTSGLKSYLRAQAKLSGLTVDLADTPSNIFRDLLRALAATAADGRCVVLIDEYDKPLLRALGTPAVLRFRDFFRGFYSVVKTEERLQRFAFITGVSKFSKVSIFSDLNNLKDYTMHPRAATLFGYTHEEILKYFPNLIHALGEANGLSFEQAYHEIIRWYDGYRFKESAPPMINPVSLGCCFDFNRISNYWSKTATPTFLVDMLRKHPLDFSTIGVSERQLEAFEPDSPDVTTLLYQTGYLTIVGCENLDGLRYYRLDFPNREVRSSFLEFLVPAYTSTDDRRSGVAVFSAAKALYAHDVPAFLKNLKYFFQNIPYDLTDRQNEQMWQAIVYVVLKAIGMTVDAEVRTFDGRIDMTCETPSDNYIIEFKLDRPAAEAMAQIRGKDYAAHFAASRKRLTLIAISFSSEKRTIVEELVEEA